ncbi:Uncharacterised protein [Yersinia intermedia]|nr:Uncharacterised protein [Yersinia intermedia]CRE38858.1 Uncharacterised protein [Yersinia intermedia]
MEKQPNGLLFALFFSLLYILPHSVILVRPTLPHYKIRLNRDRLYTILKGTELSLRQWSYRTMGIGLICWIAILTLARYTLPPSY